MIFISACLIGHRVRYDGSHKQKDALKEIVEKGKAKSLCSEILGGLSTPREPAEIIDGDGYDVWNNHASVVTISGEDVTESYKQGALEALAMCQKLGAKTLILKADSPSCGSQQIYSGTFQGSKKEGVGVFTALLRLHGIQVEDEISYFSGRSTFPKQEADFS